MIDIDEDEDPFAEDIFPLKEVPSSLGKLREVIQNKKEEYVPLVDQIQALCFAIERLEVGGEYIIRFRCAWLYNSLSPWTIEIRTADKAVLKKYEIDQVYNLELTPL